MKRRPPLGTALVVFLVSSSAGAYEAPFAPVAPIVDGVPGDVAWNKADWRPIDQPIIGGIPAADDFSGRYKLVWTPNYLFALAEITDDVLIDARADPLLEYWNDDALEIFIDEDASGGNHLNDFNAFAYHIALDNQVVDIAPSEGGTGIPQLFNEHVTAVWRRHPDSPNTLYWEVRIAVYREDRAVSGIPSVLESNKELGFMVAYCDADSPEGREHFIGDVNIVPVNGDRNRGYIDASVFGRLTLVGTSD